jgi:hypothetical protein
LVIAPDSLEAAVLHIVALECTAASSLLTASALARILPVSVTRITMHFRDQRCRRLIAAGGLPDRAGQPTQIQVHMTLEEPARFHQDPAPGDRIHLVPIRNGRLYRVQS